VANTKQTGCLAAGSTHIAYMRRRRARIAALIGALVMLGASQGARAQDSGKIYRIGVLDTTSAVMNAPNLQAFKQGLQELGYIEGRNLVAEYRSAEGRAERFPELAAELVRLRVDIIATRGTPAVLAAQKASGATPVVMMAIGEPLGVGVVAILARPGGNVTGLSAFVGELQAKRVELLREIVPGVARIAAVFNMGNSVGASTMDRRTDSSASPGYPGTGSRRAKG
jgi:putative tryptophan/tyrosine transport system substrate-binding protein